jgi:proline dehydrogenase
MRLRKPEPEGFTFSSLMPSLWISLLYLCNAFLFMETCEISFENTEIAFFSRSDRELRKTLWLFRAFNNRLIVRIGIFFLRLSVKLGMPFKKLIKNTIYKHFCGGESIVECSRSVKQLHSFNIGAILDYAVEGEDSENDFDRTCEELLSVVSKASRVPNIPFAVFKPSGIGSKMLMAKVQDKEPLSDEETAGFENIKKRFNSICRLAYEKDVRLFIDSEDSWFQDTVDDLTYEMMRKYNKGKPIVFNTYQMYRKDMATRLKEAFEYSLADGYFLGVKLVRGAYMEKERQRAAAKGYPDPIFPEKVLTDKAFNNALTFCIENISQVSVCCGSHNEESNYHLVRLINDYGLQKDDQRAYSAQLFGMSDHITYNLAQFGYNAAKYVPYGPVEAVIPYLIRRAEENTSIAGQTSRELQLIRKEMKRRKGD